MPEKLSKRLVAAGWKRAEVAEVERLEAQVERLVTENERLLGIEEQLQGIIRAQVAEINHLTGSATLRVRDLDEKAFEDLLGCRRHELEEFCRRADVLQQVCAAPLPLNLYALLPAILDADVDQARARLQELRRAPRSMAFAPLEA